MIRRMLLLSAAALLLAACDQPEQPSTSPSPPPAAAAPTLDGARLGAALQRAGEQVILPTYQSLATAAGEFAGRAESFCAAPEAAGLEALRADWLRLAGLWARADSFGFGPARLFMRDFKIAYRPLAVDKLEATLAAGGTTAAEIDKLPVNQRGLAALEYLLFAGEPAAVVERFSTQPSRCAYLQLLAGDLGRQLEDIHRAWQPAGEDHLAALVNPDGSGFYRDRAHALAYLVNGIAQGLERMRKASLAPTRTGPDGRGLLQLRAQVEGMRAVYATTAAPLLNELQRDDLARDAAAALAALQDELAALPPDAGSAALAQAQASAGGALTLFKREVIPALGVPLQFSDSDGD